MSTFASNKVRFLAVLVTIAAVLLIAVPAAFAATAVTTPADVTISADTAGDGGNTFTALPTNSPKITFDTTVSTGQTVTLTVPSGWSFATVVGEVLFGGNSCAGSFTSQNAATYVATLSGECVASDTITWNAMRVQPNAGGTTASGDIAMTLSTTSAADVADVGTLTITDGAAAALDVTGEPSSPTVAAVAISTQPIVTVLDQFGNTVTDRRLGQLGPDCPTGHDLGNYRS